MTPGRSLDEAQIAAELFNSRFDELCKLLIVIFFDVFVIQPVQLLHTEAGRRTAAVGKLKPFGQLFASEFFRRLCGPSPSEPGS